jgi:hypothetical protein
VCVPIKSDEQLLEWFNLNLENGVAYIDAQINAFDGPIQFSPTKHRLHPTVREREGARENIRITKYSIPEAKRRLLTSSMESGMIFMRLYQHIKLSFSN